MAFGYERHCPKCKRCMSYEKCAGLVLLVCSCGYEYVLEDEWVDERVSPRTIETMKATAIAKAKGEE